MAIRESLKADQAQVAAEAAACAQPIFVTRLPLWHAL